MKPEEALNTVNKMIEHGSMDINEKSDSIHTYSFWYAVRSALENQLSKKPYGIAIYEFKGTRTLIGSCPRCTYPVADHMKFCNVCGQQLDWRD